MKHTVKAVVGNAKRPDFLLWLDHQNRVAVLEASYNSAYASRCSQRSFSSGWVKECTALYKKR